MPVRPRGFDPVEVCDAVRVEDGPTVMPITSGSLGREIEADRVLVGGGLPDESIEARPGLEHHMVFGGADGDPVDVCRKQIDGETVLWLAP